MGKIRDILIKMPKGEALFNELYSVIIWKRNFKARNKIKVMSADAEKTLDAVDKKKKHIYFVGVPMHKNMGDQAQKYCIDRWLKNNYPDYDIVHFFTWPFYNRDFRDKIKQTVQPQDMIVIQSGYCTTSWHFDHPMHRFIVKSFRDNPVLIMPQTVLFSRNRDAKKTAEIYSQHSKLLFLARDKKSYESAKKYFIGTKVECYPDIVTTLIGDFEYNHPSERNGVLLCVRNDGEKLYGNDVIESLAKKIKDKGHNCQIADTNSELPLKELQKYFEDELKKVISSFAGYKVVITDRYHGTIFSLIANTPVIVLSTNDHTVKTGTEWFKGVYDGNYFNADTPDEAFSIAMRIFDENRAVRNEAYFKEHYYDCLKEKFESDKTGITVN